MNKSLAGHLQQTSIWQNFSQIDTNGSFYFWSGFTKSEKTSRVSAAA